MTQSETAKKPTMGREKRMLVRYGRMGQLGWFEHHEAHIPKTHTAVVIKSERGLEIGDLVGSHCYRGGYFKSSCEQVAEYYHTESKNFPIENAGTVVRFATQNDLTERRHIIASEKEELAACQKFADEMNLPMKMVDAEHLFGGERIIVYFSSEGRVDFRELVKKLAREYRTRIELRQIGSRDEARIISDYESCGQECCCRRFLKILEPVNMRMAKLQKATLDPSKISGHCGRLKCCLRYEDETYQELKKKLPKKNTLVRVGKFEGKVTGTEILTQLVIVQNERGDRKAFNVGEIELIGGRSSDNNTSHPDKRENVDVDQAVKQSETEPQQDDSSAKAAEQDDKEASPPKRDGNQKRGARGKGRNHRRNGRNNNNNNNRGGNRQGQSKNDQAKGPGDNNNQSPDNNT